MAQTPNSNQDKHNKGNYPKNDGFWWLITILCFCTGAFWWVGVLLIILNSSGRLPPLNRAKRQAAEQALRQQMQQRLQQVPQSQVQMNQVSQNMPQAAAQTVRHPGGKGMVVLGAVLSGLFSLGFIASLSELLEDYFDGYFFSDTASSLAVMTLLLIGSIAILALGVRRMSQGKRFDRYASMIGNLQSVSLQALSKASGLSIGRIRKDLQKMIDCGWFGEKAYLDMSSGELRRSGFVPAEEPKPVVKEPERELSEQEKILQEIHNKNDRIANPELSAKIDRIEELTRKIFTCVQEEPEKAKELQSFLNYYLPQTMKILEAYAKMEAQGVEGENIVSAKKRIENMMDTLVESFEKQLDRLFAGDVLDITSDITVMETMLARDGLTEEQLTPEK